MTGARRARGWVRVLDVSLWVFIWVGLSVAVTLIAIGAYLEVAR